MRHTILASALAAALAGCGGGGGSGATPVQPPVQAALDITLSAPDTPVLAGGAPLLIDAKLSRSAPVSWSLLPGMPGSLSVSSDAQVSYLPPPSVSAVTLVQLTAKAGGSSKDISFKLYPNPGPPGISLVAGSAGSRDVVDGSGSAARLNNVTALAADRLGQLYIVDDNALRVLSPQGELRTLDDFYQRARSELAATGYFPQMRGLALTPEGGIYLLWGAHRDSTLSTYDPQGRRQTLATLPYPGWGARALLAAGSGKFLAVYASFIVQVAADGSQRVLAGDPAAPGRLSDIRDATLAADGTLLVLDGGALRQVGSDGSVSTLVASGLGDARSLLRDADGSMLVLSRGSGQDFALLRVGADRKVQTVAQLSDPAGASASTVLRAGANGALLLGAGGRIDSYAGGRVTPLAGLEDDSVAERDGAARSARFVRPSELASDADGNLFVLDRVFDPGDASQETRHLVIRKITPDGQVSTLVSQRMGVPGGLLADARGNLYVGISPTSALLPLGGAVYRVTPQGEVQLVAGQPLAKAEIRNGSGIEARFAAPVVAGIDSDGNIIVADQGGSPAATILRKVTPGGVVTDATSPLPALGLRAWDGQVYGNRFGQLVRENADGSTTAIANIGTRDGASVAGPLPGRLTIRGRPVPYGPYRLAVISGNSIMQVVLPH